MDANISGNLARRTLLKSAAVATAVAALPASISALAQDQHGSTGLVADPRAKAVGSTGNDNQGKDNANASSVSSSAPFETLSTARVNGIRIRYRRAGVGQPVVLVHGFPETSFAWRKIMPSLAEQYTVIAPDLRGSGDTDRPDFGYDKQTMADDIRLLVRDLGLGPVRLVGHDIGMRVVYAYAAGFPDEVRQLVFIEGVLPGFGLEELYDAIRFPQMYHLPLFDAPNGLAEALIQGREAMFVEHFMRQQTFDPSGLEKDAMAEYARRLAAPGALRGGIAPFRTHPTDAEQNRRFANTKLPMPVLTIGGTASFGGKNLEERSRPLARNVRGVILDACGHYPAEEQPERVSQELLRFFAGL